MAMGKHYGAFGKGFIDSLLAVMKMKMMSDYYQARSAHMKTQDDLDEAKAAWYRGRGMGKGADIPGMIEEGERRYGGGGGDVNQETPKEGKVSLAEMVDMAHKAGFQGDDAVHMAALAQAESGGNPGAVGKAGEIGLTQINPVNGRELANSARDPQGAFDAAYKIYKQQGWGAWSTDPSSKNFTPGNNGMRFYAAAKAAAKPTETAAAPKTETGAGTGKVTTGKTEMSPAGGPYVTVKGVRYPTDATGKIVDKPVTTSQADDTKGEVQTASMDDDAGLREFLRLHPEAAPPPPPGSKIPKDVRPPISAIPPVPSVAAEDTLHPGVAQEQVNQISRDAARNRYIERGPEQAGAHPWQEGDQPPLPLVQGRERGPELAGARQWQEGDQPPLPPVQGREQGPELAGSTTGRPWQESDQPPLPPVQGRERGPELADARPWVEGDQPPLPPVQGRERGPELAGSLVPTKPPIGGGAGNVLEAPTGTPAPSAADKPAPAAQPVSAIPPKATAAPVTPRVSQDPRFTTLDYRPNAPANDPSGRGGGGPPVSTALDLSHLWGPNPPLSQRAPAVNVAPTPAPMRPQDQSFDVGSANMDDATLGAQIMGSRKGGPIQRFAGGGAIPSKPVTAFYGGGSGVDPAPQASAPTFTGAGASPGYVALRNEINADAPGGGGPNNPNWASMTPAQQQWWQNASTALAQGYSMPSSEQNAVFSAVGAYPSSTPAAAPAPAAAAPTPAPVINPPSVQNITNYPASTTVTDPTSTTTTGTPGVANTVTAKSYDPNVDATTGAGFANTASTGGTNYSVGTDDTLQSKNNIISGSRKGGPIQRFARGGGIPSRPTMKFAAGGMAYMDSPNYIGPTLQGGWAGSTPYSALAPNQQAWANTTQGLLGQEYTAAQQDAAYWGGGGQSPTGPVDTSQYWNQMTAMPSAIWPTAPSAPTPLNEPAPSVSNITAPQVNTTTIDPTSTTTTGTPGVPNTVTAKSYDPNVDATTGAGFTNTSSTGGTNYSVGTDDTLQTQNNTISGSRKGGPITPRVTRRMRYDDGGGVSPSIAGMPPGLSSGGGQQQIPPIYFNPATYAGAGAPVGKGVSATSAPTYVAGAIPSLPMLKGGVVRFADGGGVDDADVQQMQMTDMMDSGGEDHSDDALFYSGQPPGGAPAPVRQEGGLPDFTGYYGEDTGAQPTQGGGGGGGGGGASVQSGPPPGLPPNTAQIKDDDGNPSRGFIAALTGGLHWLGEHLGLGTPAQAGTLPGAIAQDPQTQTGRQNFVQGNLPDGTPKMDQNQREQIDDMADPTHELAPTFRHMAGMEFAYKTLVGQGRVEDANKMMASILHYDQLASQEHSEAAAKLLYDGHTKEAVDEINQAADALTDGRNIHATLLPDGNVKIDGSDLNGRQMWQQIAAPYALLGHLEGMRNGSTQWTSYEDQAAKYDSGFARMAKQRSASVTARQKTAADQKAQDDANKAIAGFGPEYDEPDTAPPTAPVTPPGALPGPTGGAIPISTQPQGPEGTAPSPAKSPDTTTADSNAPPIPGAGLHGIPPAPTGTATAADVRTPQDQDVDLEHNVAYQSVPAQVRPLFFTSDGRPIEGGRPLHKPEVIDQVTLKSYAPQVQAAYNERWKRYTDAETRNTQAMTTMISGMQKDIATDIASRRAAQVQTHSDTAAGTRSQNEIAAAALRQRNEVEEHKRQEQQGVTDKETLDDYTDKLKRAETRNPKEALDELGTVDPRVALAQSFLRDAAKQPDLTGDQAGTALVAAGFDPGTQQMLQEAWHAGFMNSPLTRKEDVARGVMLFASGKPGAGVLDRRTGVRNVTVRDDNGYASTFSVPEPMYQNLKALNTKNAYAAETKAAIANAPTPEMRPSTVRASSVPTTTPQDVGGPGWYKRTHPAIAPAP
jgi:hypothetical protein